MNWITIRLTFKFSHAQSKFKWYFLSKRFSFFLSSTFHAFGEIHLWIFDSVSFFFSSFPFHSNHFQELLFNFFPIYLTLYHGTSRWVSNHKFPINTIWHLTNDTIYTHYTQVLVPTINEIQIYDKLHNLCQNNSHTKFEYI